VVILVKATSHEKIREVGCVQCIDANIQAYPMIVFTAQALTNPEYRKGVAGLLEHATTREDFHFL
jgi:hypothetical protein